MSNDNHELLARIVAEGQKRRADLADAMISNLTEREMWLMREASVMGFVQGAMACGGFKREDYPGDTNIFKSVLVSARDFDDLYPYIARLDDSYVSPSEEDEDADEAAEG